MVSMFLLLGCNLSYIVDLFAALHELASASARTLLKLASSVRALLKPYGDTLSCTTVTNCFIITDFLVMNPCHEFFTRDQLSQAIVFTGAEKNKFTKN